MKINYYLKEMLKTLEITQACPGCGRMDKIAMRSKVISYQHDKTEYYLGCNCGWMGPPADNPVLAGVKWEARCIFKRLSEAKK
jgi:hypothetical protein